MGRKLADFIALIPQWKREVYNKHFRLLDDVKTNEDVHKCFSEIRKRVNEAKPCSKCGLHEGTNQIFGEKGAIPDMMYCDKCALTLF